MASIQTLQLHTVSVPLRIPHNSVAFRTDYCEIRSCNRDRTFKKLGVVVALGDPVTNDNGKNNAKKLPGHVMVVKFVNRSLPLLQDTVTRFQESVKSIPPPTLLGLCEQTVNVPQIIEAEGMEPNLIMVNVLSNAFGTAGHMEALSIYQHIREMMSVIS